jgi:hypothetical protein
VQAGGGEAELVLADGEGTADAQAVEGGAEGGIQPGAPTSP